MDYGFVKVASAIPTLKVADCDYNEKQIESLIVQAEGKGVEIICFPELSVSGYTCGDLFTQQLLIDNCENALFKLLDVTRSLNIISIIGMPVQLKCCLLNAAVVIQGGKILGVVPKTYLSSHEGHSEHKWFGRINENTTIQLCAQQVSVGTNILFHTSQTTFAVEISSDLWAPIPPSSYLAQKGAEIIFNLSADTEQVGKLNYRFNLLTQQSARCISGYVYCSSGFGESTQDSVYGGCGYVFENGDLIALGERFSFTDQLIISEIDVEKLKSERRRNSLFNIYNTESFPVIDINCSPIVLAEHAVLTRDIDPHPFTPQNADLDIRCKEIFDIQVSGLAKRIIHTNAKTLVIGISGGLDSTLALLVCTKTIDKLKRERKDIIGVTMPGFGTTDRTYNNALELMHSLGITIREINIKESCIQHFKDIDHDINVHDVTYENGQARERTQILMDIANQMCGLVVGTGDLSELALGWATYNGDHMSNYGVNASIPKTLVRHLVGWIAKTSENETICRTLNDIIDTPISPELVPSDNEGNIKQKTEDLVGPYELHDFFLYYIIRYGFRPAKVFYLAQKAFGTNNMMLGYDENTIKKWLIIFCRRFFTQQFKRSCMPDGPKVGSVCLSPRGDWCMPSDASFNQWINECEML